MNKINKNLNARFSKVYIGLRSVSHPQNKRFKDRWTQYRSFFKILIVLFTNKFSKYYKSKNLIMWMEGLFMYMHMEVGDAKKLTISQKYIAYRCWKWIKFSYGIKPNRGEVTNINEWMLSFLKKKEVKIWTKDLINASVIYQYSKREKFRVEIYNYYISSIVDKQNYSKRLLNLLLKKKKAKENYNSSFFW